MAYGMIYADTCRNATPKALSCNGSLIAAVMPGSRPWYDAACRCYRNVSPAALYDAASGGAFR